MDHPEPLVSLSFPSWIPSNPRDVVDDYRRALSDENDSAFAGGGNGTPPVPIPSYTAGSGSNLGSTGGPGGHLRSLSVDVAFFDSLWVLGGADGGRAGEEGDGGR